MPHTSQVTVYSPQLRDEILRSEPINRNTSTRKAVDHSDLAEVRRNARRERIIRQQKNIAIREHQRKQLEESDAKFREEFERRIKDKEERFRQELDDLMREADSIRAIDSKIDSANEIEKRKKEQLYQEWNDNVYNRIHEEIAHRVADMNIQDIEKKHRDLLDQYLVATNTSRGVFRDIVNPDEYDPLKNRTRQLKYSLKGIKDPLSPKGSAQPTLDKKSPKADATPVGRQVLNVLMWDKLAATPYGHFEEAEEKAAKGHHKTQRPYVNASHVVFDDYTV